MSLSYDTIYLCIWINRVFKILILKYPDVIGWWAFLSLLPYPSHLDNPFERK